MQVQTYSHQNAPTPHNPPPPMMFDLGEITRKRCKTGRGEEKCIHSTSKLIFYELVINGLMTKKNYMTVKHLPKKSGLPLRSLPKQLFQQQSAIANKSWNIVLRLYIVGPELCLFSELKRRHSQAKFF